MTEYNEYDKKYFPLEYRETIIKHAIEQLSDPNVTKHLSDGTIKKIRDIINANEVKVKMLAKEMKLGDLVKVNGHNTGEVIFLNHEIVRIEFFKGGHGEYYLDPQDGNEFEIVESKDSKEV